MAECGRCCCVDVDDIELGCRDDERCLVTALMGMAGVALVAVGLPIGADDWVRERSWTVEDTERASRGGNIPLLSSEEMSSSSSGDGPWPLTGSADTG